MLLGLDGARDLAWDAHAAAAGIAVLAGHAEIRLHIASFLLSISEPAHLTAHVSAGAFHLIEGEGMPAFMRITFCL